MLILDSNVWIYIATANDFPVEIYSEHFGEPLLFFDEFLKGRRQTAVSAYMVEEIHQGIQRSERAEGEEVDDALTKFYGLMQRSEYVCNDVDQAQLEDLSLREVRQRTHNTLLAELLDIQAKDAPIFTLAYRYRFDQPHILTDDEGFAELTPAELDISNITIEELALT